MKGCKINKLIRHLMKAVSVNIIYFVVGIHCGLCGFYSYWLKGELHALFDESR